MMFGDPALVWTDIDAGTERFRQWAGPLLDVIGIELGVGTAIPSLRYFGAERCTRIIRINPAEHEVERAQDIGLQMTALRGIEHLAQVIG
jgi:hypothetical protein